jgi:hypothetical protein
MKDFSDININYSLPPSPNLEENLQVSIFSDDNDNNCSSTADRAQLVIYVIPVIGFFPSLWTLYRRQGSREQLTASRLSITMALTWLLGYLFLTTGAENLNFFTMRILIFNSFFTSSYFLVSTWLIFRIWQGKSNRLPLVSNFAESFIGKYLS